MQSASAANTILLVEDNEHDELLTIRALKKHNILNEVVVARDGQEALDYLFAKGIYSDRNPTDVPQIVLLDLKLPKVDGLEVLRQLRQDSLTKRLPVVILTTSSEDRDITTGYDLGANSYVRKPVDFNEFSLAVKNLGIYWLLLNLRPPVDTTEKE
jgi:two-component system response regulator